MLGSNTETPFVTGFKLVHMVLLAAAKLPVVPASAIKVIAGSVLGLLGLELGGEGYA